jgi:hypothetical protein
VEPFDYLSVLISIVLGLGITQLLAGFGRWLEHRATFRAYGPSIAWAAFLLIVHVQTWWSMFGLRHWTDWTFLQFALVLLQPILLFLLTILAFPSPGSSDLDLRAYFFLQRPWFFGLFLLLLVVSILKDLGRQGHLPSADNLAFHGIFFVMGAAALVTKKEALHHVLAYLALAFIIAYITLLFAIL